VQAKSAAAQQAKGADARAARFAAEQLRAREPPITAAFVNARGDQFFRHCADAA
jgi:hypothetical protein